MLLSHYPVLLLVLLSAPVAQCLLVVPDAAAARSGSNCNRPPQQNAAEKHAHTSSSVRRLMDTAAGNQKYVLMKVRMLPTSASALLKTVKADHTVAGSPEAWVAAVVNSTAAATAHQLNVSQAALRVTFEASLGSGLNVPAVPSSRQQAAVDALAEFFEETTGTTGLLVGLNIVPGTQPPAQTNSTTQSSGSTSSAVSRGSVLALATLNGPVGDLAYILRMAAMQQQRCPELFELGAVLDLSAAGSAHRNSSMSCAAWLSDWYMPVVAGSAPPRDVSKAPPMPLGAAALQGSKLLADADAKFQANVALPLEVNIKLSIKLTLPPQGADPDALIGRARSWLQSPALDQTLQLHGLHIGAGSPAHLVTLMSSPGGSGVLQGVDEVIEVAGSNPVAAAAAAVADKADASSHHETQPELGQGYKHSGSYAASSMSAWGRLQPHELQPLVIGHQDTAALAEVQHSTAEQGPELVGGADEIAKRTVLGAIIGAVLGSAAVGAALTLTVAAVLRRRRAMQLQSASCNACEESSSRPGRVSTRGGSTGGRRRSRKRYLKYLPNMSAPHLLPVTASPCAGSSMGGTASPSNSWMCADNSPASVAAQTVVSGPALCLNHSTPLQQPVQQQPGQAYTGNVHFTSACPGSSLLSGLQVGVLGSHAGSLPAGPQDGAADAASLEQPSSLAAGLQAASPAPQHQQQAHAAASAMEMPQLQRHSQPAAPTDQQQQRMHPHQHNSLGSRLRQSLALLRPAASDPLQQGSRARRVDAQHDRRDWAAADNSTPVLSRQDLCTDSVSSAAHIDLMHNLQRSASAGSSRSSSDLGRSLSSSSSNGSAMGSAQDNSAGAGSSQGRTQHRPLHEAPALGVDPGSTQSNSGLQHSRDPVRLRSPTLFIPLARMQAHHNQTHHNQTLLVTDHQPASQQPLTAWSNSPCEPSVAAAGVACSNSSRDVQQGGTSAGGPQPAAGSSHMPLQGSADAAGAGSSGSRNAAMLRPVPKASPFLNYDFTAADFTAAFDL